MVTRDRRRYERRGVERACKVYHPASRRYAAGRTVNLSAGGALVKVEGSRPLEPGEELDVIVAWDARAVLPAESMLRGRVVRADGPLVAVEFDEAVVGRAAA